MSATTFKVDSAFRHPSKQLLMLVAELGIGRTRNVFNAPTTGCSTLTEFVYQFLVNVRPSTLLELAFPVMLVTT
jgi:hypothetical protein